MSSGESEYLNNLSGYTSEVTWEIAEEQWRRATDDREFGPPDEQEAEESTLQDEVDHSCPTCEEPMELHSIDPVEDTICYYCKRCDQHWVRTLG